MFRRKNYRIDVLRLKNHTGDSKVFQVETILESKRLEDTKLFLLKNIDKIIENNWGKFSKDFISKHVVKANRLKIVRSNNEVVAIASASLKKILNKDVLYLEFTVINENVQGYNLTTILNGTFIYEEVLSRLSKLIFTPLNAITITRNMRVIGAVSHFSSFIYPDPREFEMKGRLSNAGELTWQIANEVLKESWNPKRELLREGNILIGSYEDAPWLILPKIQKHYNSSILKMGEYYLRFKAKQDREFLVHAQFNFLSALKFFIWKKLK